MPETCPREEKNQWSKAGATPALSFLLEAGDGLMG